MLPALPSRTTPELDETHRQRARFFAAAREGPPSFDPGRRFAGHGQSQQLLTPTPWKATLPNQGHRGGSRQEVLRGRNKEESSSWSTSPTSSPGGHGQAPAARTGSADNLGGIPLPAAPSSFFPSCRRSFASQGLKAASWSRWNRDAAHEHYGRPPQGPETESEIRNCLTSLKNC